MDKIVAFIMSFLIAASNGLKVVFPANPVFTNNNYYKGSNSEQVDYKKLYSQYSNEQAGETEACITTKQKLDKLSFPCDVTRYAWFVNDDDATASNYKFPPEGKDEFKIVAPGRCTLKTSSRSCDNGHTLSIDCGPYVIEFNNLKCWYCCAHKETPPSGNYTHTGADLKGTSFNQGEWLAVGIPETTVTITLKSQGNNNSAKVSIESFYTNTNINNQR